MYICNYCKRNYKEKFEICPACGGKSFSEKAYFGEIILKTPPEGGYTVSNKTFKTKLKHIKVVTLIGVISSIAFCLFLAPFLLGTIIFSWASIQEHQFFFDIDLLLFIIPSLIPIIIIIITIIYNIHSKKKIKKDKERIKYLANHGILVKCLPFELVSDGSHFMGNPLYFFIKVSYENANGVKIPLLSDKKYDDKEIKSETVDLLIDPNNYSNYYIDFEIY